jgi:hypothetical protein
MNPLHWKREHQIAFLVAVVFCACIGIFAGVRQVEASTDLYWLWVALWGAAGAAMGAAGAFIRQLMRNRISN